MVWPSVIQNMSCVDLLSGAVTRESTLYPVWVGGAGAVSFVR